jgi:hypothetical protein
VRQLLSEGPGGSWLAGLGEAARQAQEEEAPEEKSVTDPKAGHGFHGLGAGSPFEGAVWVVWSQAEVGVGVNVGGVRGVGVTRASTG